MIKITSFTAHQTAEGMRLTYTYSVIAEDGSVTKSNERAPSLYWTTGSTKRSPTSAPFCSPE